MGKLPILKGIEVPDSLIGFAKDLALRHELSGEDREEAVVGTIELLNKVLMPTFGEERTVLRASRLYDLPYYDADVQVLTEEDVMASQLPEALVEGKVEYVQWFASMSLKSFGLRLAEVNFIEPDLPSLPKVYVPIEAVEFGMLVA